MLVKKIIAVSIMFLAIALFSASCNSSYIGEQPVDSIRMITDSSLMPSNTSPSNTNRDTNITPNVGRDSIASGTLKIKHR